MKKHENQKQKDEDLVLPKESVQNADSYKLILNKILTIRK